VRDGDAIAAFQRGDLERARRLAQEGLAAEPQAAKLQHLMGLIQCRMGELESGIEWLRRASAAEPDDVPYRVMLARALIDSGRPQEALEVSQPPSGTSPAELALWHARAEAATAAEQADVAAEAWHVMCSTRSGDWRAWANLGDALARLEKWPEAASALRYARNLNPG